MYFRWLVKLWMSSAAPAKKTPIFASFYISFSSCRWSATVKSDWLTLLWHLAKTCLWNTPLSVLLLIGKIDLQVKSSFVRNPTTEHTDKTSAWTVLVSWFSAIKRSYGIQVTLMNSYQIPEAMFFWAPRWEAACRREFLYVQNDKTLQILFCIWQCSQCQLQCSTAIAFPNCLSCINWQDASLPVPYYL